MENNERRKALLAMIAAPVGVAACATAEGGAHAGGGHHNHAQLLADLQGRLDVAESRTAISETLFRYARANDRADEAMMRDCFWPESQHKHGRFEGTSQDFVTYAVRVVTNLKFAAHHLSNVSIEINGDRAFSECHYFAHHRRNVANTTDREEDAFFEGRYIDIHERRDGVWKIIRRRGVSDFNSPVIPATALFADWTPGHSEHAPNDAYYQIRQDFLAGS
ncbi:MAG: nuclear transport factor 2 family protein [Hyphomonadaceae bacterium]